MFRLVTLNLWRTKRRLLTGLAGVALAVALMMLINGFAAGMFSQSSAYAERNGADIFIGERGVDALQNVVSLIPRSIEKDVKAVEGIAEVAPLHVVPVILEVGERKTTVTLYGVSPDASMGVPWKMAAGRMLEGDDEVVMDLALARQNGLNVGGLVQILGKEFRISGLSAETSAYMNAAVFVSEQSAGRLMGSPDLVSFLLVKATGRSQVELLKNNLSEKFPALGILTRDEMAVNTRSQLEDSLGPPLAIILGVAFLVGLMVVSLTTHTVVLEKSRELGMLKAVGAKNQVLYGIVLIESLYWTVTGFAAGWLLSEGAAWAIMRASPQLSIVNDAVSMVKAGFLTLAIILVSCLTSVRRVAALDPARAFNS